MQHDESVEITEAERIKRIRESDITRDIHKFDEAFRDSMKLRRQERTLLKTPPWATFLLENPIKTREQLADFREKFPDAQGEVIMMQILKLAGKLSF